MQQNSNKKPVLAVVAGPNGSGKTTITEALLKHHWLESCVYINPDNMAKELGDWNNPDFSLQAARQAEALREKLLSQGESIAFETVFSAPDKLDFVKRAKLAGYFVRLFFVSTDCPSINAARITKRYLLGGHEVPISKIVDRYYKSIQQGVDAIAYADRLDVFDNSQEGSGAWLRLFKYGPEKKLKLLVNEKELPEWSLALFKEAKGVALNNANSPQMNP